MRFIHYIFVGFVRRWKKKTLYPVYTIPLLNKNGTKSCQFGLPFTLKHKWKTLWQRQCLKNGMKHSRTIAWKWNDFATDQKEIEYSIVLVWNKSCIDPFVIVYIQMLHTIVKSRRFQIVFIWCRLRQCFNVSRRPK